MWPYFWIAREIAANLAMGIPAVRSARLRRNRTMVADPVEQAARVREQFAFFASAIGPFEGKTIVEVGPGDSIALAPLFIGAGAKKYIAIDRFLGDVYGDSATQIYRALSAGEWQKDVELHACSIEDAFAISADVIVSYNALEHLGDLGRAFKNMARMLEPGAVMAHRIDYGPHDVWERCENKLEFLSFPDWLWNLMGSNRGYPNRLRHDAVLALLHDAGFSTKAKVTETFAGMPLNAELVSVLPAVAPIRR
jgi:SAM-dependent methyltransferase